MLVEQSTCKETGMFHVHVVLQLPVASSVFSIWCLTNMNMQSKRIPKTTRYKCYVTGYPVPLSLGQRQTLVPTISGTYKSAISQTISLTITFLTICFIILWLIIYLLYGRCLDCGCIWHIGFYTIKNRDSQSRWYICDMLGC